MEAIYHTGIIVIIALNRSTISSGLSPEAVSTAARDRGSAYLTNRNPEHTLETLRSPRLSQIELHIVGSSESLQFQAEEAHGKDAVVLA